MPLAEACLKFTNLHRAFGLGRAYRDGPAPRWADYTAGLCRSQALANRLDWTIAFFAQTTPEPREPLAFGCFRYEPATPDGLVRIHFTNRDSDDGVGPLHHSKVDRRLKDLSQMFQHIRAHQPAAQTIRGGSWLYNLEAYRRLFPPEYIASRREPTEVRLDGTSSWGQLVDSQGKVHLSRRQALLDNLPRLKVEKPWRVFPYPHLDTEAPIQVFYRHYDI